MELFQSLSGLSLGLNCPYPGRRVERTDAFQSLSGLSLGLNRSKHRGIIPSGDQFQSLSGLSLGLNAADQLELIGLLLVSIPFRAVTGFERALVNAPNG